MCKERNFDAISTDCANRWRDRHPGGCADLARMPVQGEFLILAFHRQGFRQLTSTCNRDNLMIVRLLFHLVAGFLRAIGQFDGRGLVKQAIAENLLLRHQLMFLNRSKKQEPQVSRWDRLYLGFMGAFLRPRRMIRIGLV